MAATAEIRRGAATGGKWFLWTDLKIVLRSYVVAMWCVYILQSERTGRYYTGHTENLERRIKEHNSGKTQSLKAYLPVRVIYKEIFSSKQEAYKREKQIKSYKGGRAFKRLVERV